MVGSRPSAARSARTTAGLLVLQLAMLVTLPGVMLSCGDAQPTASDGSGEARGHGDETGIDARLEALRASHPTLSPNAQVGLHLDLVEDVQAIRDPSDGGGAIEHSPGSPAAPPARIVVGTPVSLPFVYIVGPLGVADGGMLFVEPTPFWGWDVAQAEWPEAPGYTTVEWLPPASPGLPEAPPELTPRGLGDQLMIGVRGRALVAGERIRIVYGAGPAKARSDRYAERTPALYMSVDGDGDGIRGRLSEGLRVVTVAREPTQLAVMAPSTAEPGETITLRVSLLDAVGNADSPATGRLRFVDPPAGARLPKAVVFDAASAGSVAVPVRFDAAGVMRLRLAGEGALAGLEGESNPIVVDAGLPRLLWGDLHGHSALSDGTGTPEDYYRYARDVASLDVAALTDHDHWGMFFIDSHPELWQRIRVTVAANDAPGEFVALLGFEWTSWLHGHRHVLYFEDDGPVVSSVDPATDSPDELWEVLRERPALTFAHHSAGGPVATNWAFAPDPVLEPVTEIASVHGSSEAWDTPGRIYDPVRGNFVRDVLQAGARLGFIGSGDSHDGHPGLAQLGAPAGGGLAGIFAEEKTRDAVLEALRARRTLATNGIRPFLQVRIDGQPMGGSLPYVDDETRKTSRLELRVVATAPIERIDLVRSGALASLPGEGLLEMTVDREIPRLLPGEYHYVRIVQEDGGVAWTSPIFAERGPS